MEEKKTKKRHNATITFSRKEQKEEMLQHLNSVQLQNLMPDEVKGKDCLKVLWAVEYLHRLAVDGKIRVQIPMFEEDSQEKRGLLDEISTLKAENKQLSDLEDGYIDNINSLIRLLEFYRRLTGSLGLKVDEDLQQYCYKVCPETWMKP